MRPEPIIRVDDVYFSYHAESDHPVPALRGINLAIAGGEYLAIVGHNGSGKSTLAKLFNGLLKPTRGTIWVKGRNSSETNNIPQIRRTVGMVFQVPDNQIVATEVEADVAFGVENLGVPSGELQKRVDYALEQVGLTALRHRAPHLLSAGQKQRVAIAGVLAMQPEVIVLDEATAMLDPQGRADVLAAVRDLNRQGITVVTITHFMDEAAEADRVVVMEAGRVVLEGTAPTVFRQVERLRTLQLDVPQVTELAYRLHQRDVTFPVDLLNLDAFLAQLKPRLQQAGQRGSQPQPQPVSSASTGPAVNNTRPVHEPLVTIRNLHHTYLRGTPLAVEALKGVTLEIHSGEAVGLIGRTGSGKSTLAQFLNGLIRPRQRGVVVVAGQDLADPNVDIYRLRQKMGLVFQYPEQQMFERYLGDDIAFGPRKLGLSREEVRNRVREAMEAVGLPFQQFKDRFTFGLSGGEMRKAAIAGVLATQPTLLVLDESTSGVDPRGRAELLARIAQWNRQAGLTVLFISPNMEDLTGLVERVYVLDDGRIVMAGHSREVFGQPEKLREYGLKPPQVTQIAQALQVQGYPITPLPLTVEEAEQALWKILNS